MSTLSLVLSYIAVLVFYIIALAIGTLNLDEDSPLIRLKVVSGIVSFVGIMVLGIHTTLQLSVSADTFFLAIRSFGNLVVHGIVLFLGDGLFEKMKVKVTPKSEKNKVKRMIPPLFTEGYTNTLARIIQFAYNTGYFYEEARDNDRPTIGSKYINGTGGWSSTPNSLVNAITSFVNLNLSLTKRFEAEVIEALMLEVGNVGKVGLLINILEDKEKFNFLIGRDGYEQRKLIIQDIESMTTELREEVKEITDLKHRTSVNNMNSEINSLRSYNFSKIEDMKRGE